MQISELPLKTHHHLDLLHQNNGIHHQRNCLLVYTFNVWYALSVSISMSFEVFERRGRERLKMTWISQVEELIGIKNENAIDRSGAMLCIKFWAT